MPQNDLEEILRFFSYTHLPEKLQDVSAPFCKLAHDLAARYVASRELLKALDFLLAAKDAAVRAVLFPPHSAK